MSKPGDLPVLDDAVIARLRTLAAVVARPGEDVVFDLACLFRHDSEARLHELEHAWRSRLTKDALRAAHTLKGSAGNVGAVRVVAAAVAVHAIVDHAFVDGDLDRLRDELRNSWTALGDACGRPLV